MTKKKYYKKIEKDSTELTNLLISMKESKKKIENQIEKGNNILNTLINTKEDLEKVRLSYNKWDSFNAELFGRIFNTTQIQKEYSALYSGVFSRSLSDISLLKPT